MKEKFLRELDRVLNPRAASDYAARKRLIYKSTVATITLLVLWTAFC